jgi:hypothetical protein
MSEAEDILELLPEKVLEARPREDGGFDTVEQYPRARLGELLRDVEQDLSDEAFMEIEAFVDKMISSGEAGKFSWWRDYGADWPPRHTQNLCTSVANVAYSVGSKEAEEYL